MRIIAGEYKGRTLFYGHKKEHRPTQDRVKEALFNMIQADCEGTIVLDAFAGTGSLGLEALSRGAEKVIFIDKYIDFLKKNTNWLNDSKKVEIKRKSILNYIKSTSLKFDLIFLDPPWNQLELFDITLKLIFDFDIISNNGLIICEHPKSFEIGYFSKSKQTKTIGSTSLTLISK
tara:strand:- start:5084 stop:5608 length:525 start_codon:yes stop_codon:yes gene_type:complete